MTECLEEGEHSRPHSVRCISHRARLLVLTRKDAQDLKTKEANPYKLNNERYLKVKQIKETFDKGISLQQKKNSLPTLAEPNK